MNGWLLGEVVLLAVLCVALWFRARLGHRFQLVSMAVTALIVGLCTVESVTEGARPWTIALGVVAVVLFAYEFLRQARRSSS